LSLVDFRVLLLKVARIEQQQLHQTQLIQRILEVMQATDHESGELPREISLPVKSITALKELERKLEDDDNYRRLVIYNFELITHLHYGEAKF
jgi:hypothetical protein